MKGAGWVILDAIAAYLVLHFVLGGLGVFDAFNCGGKKPDTVVHDTTIVHDSILIPVREIVIKYMKAPVDSTLHADSTKWYTATGADTTEGGDTVGVVYNSPVRLSPLGFFSDFIVKHAPVWVPIDTVFIRTTITKYEKYIAWEWVVGFGGVLALVLHLILR